MTDHPVDEQFPAVGRLRTELRADLVRAARAHPGVRSRLFRRRPVAALAVVAVMAAPAGLAGAGVFSSSGIEYECRAAEKLHQGSEIEVGVPAEGPGAADPVVEELPAPPESPCDEDEGAAQGGAR
jgi:hypothetical protein